MTPEQVIFFEEGNETALKAPEKMSKLTIYMSIAAPVITSLFCCLTQTHVCDFK